MHDISNDYGYVYPNGIVRKSDVIVILTCYFIPIDTHTYMGCDCQTLFCTHLEHLYSYNNIVPPHHLCSDMKYTSE